MASFGDGLGKAMEGMMYLAVVGVLALVIGVPVGLFFLIRWLIAHLTWQ